MIFFVVNLFSLFHLCCLHSNLYTRPSDLKRTYDISVWIAIVTKLVNVHSELSMILYHWLFLHDRKNVHE